MRFAPRLVAGTVLVLFFTVAILVWTAERSLRRDLEADVRRNLEREARLVREALPTDPARWAGAVRRLSAENGHAITLLDTRGAVVAASDADAAVPDRATPGELPADVQAALAGAPGVLRVRDASGALLLAVALPGGPGVVRLAADLAQVDAVVQRAQGAIFSAAALALLVGSGLALVAGNSVARPLTQIAGAADAIAVGGLPRFPHSGIPDIDALVQALRAMHRQLTGRFDELRAERAESAAIVETMVEGVIAADARGTITTANPAARRLLGYGPDEPLPALPQLFRVKAAREAVDAVMAGTPVRDRAVELDGRLLGVSALPLPQGGAVLVLHDQTELRRLETVRRDFVANVSHELKTPLTSIGGYAETLLEDDVEPAVRRRFLGIVLANARRMQRLVDDLLDLARIEAGRWQARPEGVDVRVAGRDAWATVAERAAQRGVAFALDVPDDAAGVWADPDALRQVLTNLFDNAIRHTPRGGRVTLVARGDTDGVAVAVRDTGSGIGSEHLPRIFERFYRADAARSRDEGGTGLGLAIVKHMVEGHGGRVAVESQLGVGTAVRCWFPAPAEGVVAPPQRSIA